MRLHRILSKSLLGLSIALAAIAPASAQLQTSFLVTASIAGTCSAATATELAFGNYDGGQNDRTSTITVTCSTGTSYEIGLNDGANYNAPNRRMKHGAADYLNYELYSDAGRTTRWGNDDSGDVHMISDGTAQNIDVYGRMPAGQNGPIGSYADTITVTVTLSN
ncbi:biofilm synthesis protein [Ferrigenium kumadai]|uniref:Biofilm synthesis protein n=1 Tax=Ferrigenium kumadai TaxID=1682490 RepID=A0AAN1T0N2_9PROT|nr:spore coat U domain-containing protein [Ferrigenium kumadai]BBI99209.1 biofilm synthesis protein [Ferrigenium kumadai]